MPYRFPAVRYVQNRRTFYVLSLSSGFFIDHAVVDVYDPTLSIPGHPKGYQRAVEEGRARKIADYLKTNSAVLPTSILLNVRQKEALRWEGDRETSGSPGVLTIPDGATVYVVDGQHRQAGLAVVAKTRPSIREFPVPAILMEGFEMVDEALQFYLINTKAKKVPTDLSRRLLLEFDQVQYLEAPKKWILNALRVTIALESKLDNPWRGKIRPANAAKQPYHICSERSF